MCALGETCFEFATVSMIFLLNFGIILDSGGGGRGGCFVLFFLVFLFFCIIFCCFLLFFCCFVGIVVFCLFVEK